MCVSNFHFFSPSKSNLKNNDNYNLLLQCSCQMYSQLLPLWQSNRPLLRCSKTVILHSLLRWRLLGNRLSSWCLLIEGLSCDRTLFWRGGLFRLFLWDRERQFSLSGKTGEIAIEPNDTCGEKVRGRSTRSRPRARNLQAPHPSAPYLGLPNLLPVQKSWGNHLPVCLNFGKKSKVAPHKFWPLHSKIRPALRELCTED